jgi:TP901 family phage tail tape measure protein
MSFWHRRLLFSAVAIWHQRFSLGAAMSIKLGSAYGKVSLDVNGVRSGVATAKKSLGDLVKAGHDVGATLENIGGAMQNVGRSLTATFTLPVVLAGTKAFQVMKDFDQNLNVLKAVSGATSEEFEKLKNLARELGADLTLPGTSAADAASAMAELAKAGLSVNEVMGAARGVLQLSAAGQIDNARAAEITANALNAFKLKGEDAVHVADLLAAAANASSADVSEMADSLQMAAAVMAMSDQSIEETTTALGLLANAGIQGSDAGTSLKQMFLALETPASTQKAIMKKYALSIYDAAGNMKSMRQIIEDFSKKLGGLNDKQRNYALGVLFGSDAIRAANIVLMQGVDAYDQMYNSVNKVGAASRLAQSLMEGLPGVVENIKSSFETAAIAAIEPLKDDLIAIGNTIAKVLNAFSSLPAPVREVIAKMVLLGAAIGPALFVLGSLVTTVGRIYDGFKLLQLILPSVSVGLNTSLVPAIANVGTTLWTALVPAVGALGAALLPILAIVASLIFIGGILAAAWVTDFAFMRSGITTALNVIKSLWKAFTAFLRGDSDEAIEHLREAWDTLVNHFTKIFEKFSGVREAWANFLEFMRDLLGRVVSYISDVFSKTNWSQLGKFVTIGIANGMLLGIPSLISAALKAAESALAAIKSRLGIKSPSKAFEQLGLFSGQGFQLGLARAMSAEDIARTMARPINQLASSQQQVVNNYFATGLTVREVSSMIDQRHEEFTRTILDSLGSA